MATQWGPPQPDPERQYGALKIQETTMANVGGTSTNRPDFSVTVTHKTFLDVLKSMPTNATVWAKHPRVLS